MLNITTFKSQHFDFKFASLYSTFKLMGQAVQACHKLWLALQGPVLRFEVSSIGCQFIDKRHVSLSNPLWECNKLSTHPSD